MRAGFTLCLCAALSLVVTGCASTKGENGLLSVIDQKAAAGPQACMQITTQDIDSNYGRTVAEGTAIWAFIGAAGGALLGAATGNSRSVAEGAAIGGAIGATGGAISGVQTANAKQQYALQEAQLDCQTKAAKADNEKLKKMVETTRAAVAQTEKQLADLEGAYAAKRTSRDEAQKELASVDESTASIQRNIDAMNKRLAEYQQARDSTMQASNNSLNTAELDKQIADLNTQIDAAEADLGRLVDHRKVAQVG